MSDASAPLRGEVWLVNFDPTLGAEIRKTRPAVVVSSDGIGRLPVRLVAPLTEWKDAFENCVWLVRVDPDSTNGLRKTSAADVLQLRGMDLRRFVVRLGYLPAQTMDEVADRHCRGEWLTQHFRRGRRPDAPRPIACPLARF